MMFQRNKNRVLAARKKMRALNLNLKCCKKHYGIMWWKNGWMCDCKLCVCVKKFCSFFVSKLMYGCRMSEKKWFVSFRFAVHLCTFSQSNTSWNWKWHTKQNKKTTTTKSKVEEIMQRHRHKPLIQSTTHTAHLFYTHIFHVHQAK